MKLLPLLPIAAIGLGAALIAPSAHAILLTNGDFSSGLTGWTPYTLTNGAIGTPAVISFDVTGFGQSPAATLNVGEVAIQGIGSGGGLSQTFVGPAGDYSFSYDFASEDISGNGNNSGGLYSLIFDGTELASFDIGTLGFGGPTVKRGSLSAFLAGVTAGSHEIRIQATRPFLKTSTTPAQYFDNVVVNVSGDPAAVPAPLPLLGAGAALGFSRKLRKRIQDSKSIVGSEIN